MLIEIVLINIEFPKVLFSIFENITAINISVQIMLATELTLFFINKQKVLAHIINIHDFIIFFFETSFMFKILKSV